MPDYTDVRKFFMSIKSSKCIKPTHWKLYLCLNSIVIVICISIRSSIIHNLFDEVYFVLAALDAK